MSILPLTFAMAAFGALLGLWVAWSGSPIAATALPLIFGLVGGTGGYWLMKADLGEGLERFKGKTLGI
jgi:hypothetical protein